RACDAGGDEPVRIHLRPQPGTDDRRGRPARRRQQPDRHRGVSRARHGRASQEPADGGRIVTERDTIIEVKGLRAGYGAVEVLRGIDLTIRRGDIVALLGSNGVGKTTFNAVLSGLIRPWAGTVKFNGADVTGCDAVHMVDAGLSLVPEGRLIFPNLTVKENLILGAYRRAGSRREANIDKVVSIFPRLKERFEQKAGTLS